MYGRIWLYPRFQRGSEREPPAGGAARQGRGGAAHLHGQAVGQGLRPAAVQAAGEKNEAGRPALCAEHRPAGAGLWGDTAAMAAADQGKEGGHLCAGYAAAGHPAGERPDGHIHCRSGAANPLLCGPV